MTGPLSDADRDSLHELAPVLRRAVALDPNSLARLRLAAAHATVLVRLPFGVLVSRKIATQGRGDGLDVTVGAGTALAWLDEQTSDPPPARDAEWRGGLPPARGWTSVESVPGDVVRSLVRSGARTLAEAAAREGAAGAQPRAEVADALLGTTVLTVDDEAGARAEVSLRALSAMTRMGFLPADGHARIDVRGRWVRVVAAYGTVYLERPGGLTLR